MFWSDLTYANGMNLNLIEGVFNSVFSNAYASVGACNPSAIFPSAKVGQETYIYVYSSNGSNYYGLSFVSCARLSSGAMVSAATLPVRQAYSIDKKIDDGLPQSGNVTAQYILGYSTTWADLDFGPGDGTPTPPSGTTCYDDGGATGATRQYSVNQIGGNGPNCALSFKFQ